MRFVSFLLGMALWILVLVLTSLVVSTGILGGVMERFPWLSSGTVSQVTMLAASVAIMLALGRGHLRQYGFRMVKRREIRTVLIYGSIVAVLVQTILALVWRLVPPSGGHPVLAGSSFLRIVITVWVVASICEEVFLRGLIQTSLRPLKEIGVTLLGNRLSLPVIAGAVMFGLMHIMLLTLGADGSLVAGIVGSATVLGVVAGYYREKTDSLVPAILVHMLFNIYGSVSQYIQSLAAG
jgi:membrane protease YdiL (CAAX protease family)